MVHADPRLRAGDVVYLIAAYSELYGWGYVVNVTTYRDDQLGKEAFKVKVTRPVVRHNLVQAEAIKRLPTLGRIFETSDLNLIELQPHQVNTFNRLIRSQGAEAPADVEEVKNPGEHLYRLEKVYFAANGSRTTLIELMDVLRDVKTEEEAWDEADYMRDEGWVETIGDNGPPLVRLLHKGVKAAEASLFPTAETANQSESQIPAQTAAPANISGNSTLDIFISHSSQDVKIAAALIDLLKAALNLPSESIRCTSVAGYQLPVGADVDEHLQREIYDSKVFIGIISPSSLDSTYVLFELGARWGAKRPLLPVLALADKSVLKEPLKSKHAGCLYISGDIHNLLSEVSRQVGKPLDKVASYERHLKTLIRRSKPKTERKPKTANNEANTKEAARKRDEEADIQMYAQLCKALDEAGGNGYEVTPGSPEHLWAERMVQKGLLKRLASGRFYSLPDGRAF